MEWVDSSENQLHAFRNGLNKGKIKAVCQYDLKNNFIDKFESIKEANKHTGINKADICSCCKGKFKKAGNFIWKYDRTI